MKKILISCVLVAIGFIYWVIEPFHLNPFKEPEFIVSVHSDDFKCSVSARNNVDSPTIAIDKFVQANSFLGVSAGFYSEKCGTYSIATGFSNKWALTQFTSTTHSRIASITKPVTAIAIMQLSENGLLDIDEPVQSFLPDFPSSSATVRQLLNHTSGLPHYSSKLDAISFTNYLSLQDALQTIYQRGTVAEPGSRYIYSSFGYTVLGRVIEVVSGQRYTSYIEENVLLKAGMLDTSFESEEWSDKKSGLYLKVNSLYIKAPRSDLSIIQPAGGLQSTAGDLLKFAEAIIKDKLVKRETLLKMIDVEGSLAPAAGDDPYGLGWAVNDIPHFGKVISHSGSQPGAGAYFQIFLDSNMATVALSNAFGTRSSARELSFSMTNLQASVHFPVNDTVLN